MKINSRNIWFCVITTIIVTVLTFAYINSSRLVKNFERNIERREFKPEAERIVISEVDSKMGRSWKIEAERGLSDSTLSTVHAEEIHAYIYDSTGEVKLNIQAPKADIEKEQNSARLYQPAQVIMATSRLKLIANEFLIDKDQPFRANGQVQVYPSPEDNTQKINAERAVIATELDDMTLFTISPSPLSKGTTLEGGRMDFDFIDSKPSEIIVSQGVVVKNANMMCKSQEMKVTLDSKGEPVMAVFTGRPVATQNGTQITAARIEYNFGTGRVTAAGSVKSRKV